jgi:hypothetical protein
MPGLFGEARHNGKLFLSAADGMSIAQIYWSASVLTVPSFSVLPALSLNDGIIHCDIVEGSFCTDTFEHFVEGLLNHMQPYPASNSVIVMDNCRIHKHPRIVAMIEER